jgi:hypothetical protein
VARQLTSASATSAVFWVLEVHQYVNLSDAAWGNGDVRDPTAKVVLANPGVNPNLYTVSIEHEDGSTGGRGVVQPDTWQASIELGVLLASGDIAAIRAAGIRIRDDATAAQLKAIPATIDGHIDHHQIAGPNKPYCWREWLDDPGFVKGNPSRRDELLAALPADSLSPLELCQKRLRRVRQTNAELVAEIAALEEEAARVPRLLRRIRHIKELAAQIQEE